MAHRRSRARRNPSDPNVTYWLVLGTILAGATAYWGYKNMTSKDRETAGLP